MSGTNRIVIALLLAMVAALAIFAWQANSRANDADRRLGLDAARVTTAVFTNARDM